MIEEVVEIDTGEGAMETFVCHPERHGPHPAVLFGDARRRGDDGVPRRPPGGEG